MRQVFSSQIKSSITVKSRLLKIKICRKTIFYENMYISKRTAYPIYSKVFCDLRALIGKDITNIVIEF